MGKTAMVTGASSGIGFELTKKLIKEGWEVIALIRSGLDEGEPLIGDALQNKKIRIYNADVSDYQSLRPALEQIKKNEEHIDVLFSNAGVGTGELRYSVQGRELHYEVNTVVPYIIAFEMKELIKKGTFRTIINTSSNALLTVKKFDLRTLEKPGKFKKLFGSYALSKLALSLWTAAAAPVFETDRIEIRSVCPGANKTPMTGSSGMPFLLKMISKFMFAHPSSGALTLYKSLTDLRGINGSFINKGKPVSLKFLEQGAAVFLRLNEIYTREYLKIG